jgi:hypothetical protein
LALPDAASFLDGDDEEDDGEQDESDAEDDVHEDNDGTPGSPAPGEDTSGAQATLADLPAYHLALLRGSRPKSVYSLSTDYCDQHAWTKDHNETLTLHMHRAWNEITDKLCSERVGELIRAAGHQNPDTGVRVSHTDASACGQQTSTGCDEPGQVRQIPGQVRQIPGH